MSVLVVPVFLKCFHFISVTQFVSAQLFIVFLYNPFYFCKISGKATSFISDSTYWSLFSWSEELKICQSCRSFQRTSFYLTDFSQLIFYSLFIHLFPSNLYYFLASAWFRFGFTFLFQCPKLFWDFFLLIGVYTAVNFLLSNVLAASDLRESQAQEGGKRYPNSDP